MMINISVWAESGLIDIEGKLYETKTQEQIIVMLTEVLDKAFFSGERVCLERARIDDGNKVYFGEVKRWPA